MRPRPLGTRQNLADAPTTASASNGRIGRSADMVRAWFRHPPPGSTDGKFRGLPDTCALLCTTGPVTFDATMQVVWA